MRVRCPDRRTPYQAGDRVCGGCGRTLAAFALRQPGTTAGARPSTPVLAVFTALCTAFVVVGSFGPWAQVLFAVKNGVEGDGQIPLALGGLAGALTVLRLVRPAYGRKLIGPVAGLLVLSAFVAVIDWVDLTHRRIDEQTPLIGGITITVGWGLQMVAVASVTGSVLALIEAGQQVLRLRFAFWPALAAPGRAADGPPAPEGVPRPAAPADYVPSDPADRRHDQ